jgi:hypothetical protein
MDLESIKSAFGLAGQALGLLKQAKEMIPEGAQRDAAEKSIADAEQAFSLAEAKAAQELGYELCRCTWPPQICLRIDGRDHICPKCGHQAFHRLPEDDYGCE